MGVHDGRTALTVGLRAFDAACRAAGIEPTYVLLRDKRAFQKAWQDRRPTVDEAAEHLDRSSKHAVGVQPASLGCVVLDCDDGDGPDAAAEWAGEAHAVTTPSSSGLSHKGHVWVRCDAADAVGNWKFRVEDPIDGEALGELRTRGGQVRLRAQSIRLLARAVEDGTLTDGPRLSPVAFAGIRTSGGAASAEGIKLDWDDGLEVGIDDLPEAMRERVLEPVAEGERSEAVASVVWSIMARGFSAASALSILAEHCGFAIEKYGDRLETQVEKLARDFLATKEASIADDFDDLNPDDLPEGLAGEADDADADRKDPLERMNDRYCCGMVGSQFRVMWRERDPNTGYHAWTSVSKEAFFDMLAHKRVEKGDKTVPLGKAWFEWGGRRQYSGVVFDPDREHEGYLNLWTGFGVEPDRTASCERLVEMVREVLCGGHEASFEYLMNWLAWKAQNPGRRNEVAVVFRGEKGVGKTTLGEVMTDIFGAHGFVAKHVDEVAGRFNGHLAQTAFLFGDEVMWGGDREAEGRLKKLITDASTSTERKGQDIQRSTNRVSLMMATNERWAVPVSLEGERRFFVLDVPSHRKAPKDQPDHPNRIYWNELRHELDDGGREAFFAALLDRELPRGWHPRSSVPDTAGLAKQIVESLDLMQQWYLEAVQSGVLPGRPSDKDTRGKPPGWQDGACGWEDVDHYDPPRLDPTSVLEDLRAYVRANGSRQRVHHTTVTPFLKDFGWESRKSNGIVTYRPPSLEAAKDAWRQKLGRWEGGSAVDLFDDGAEEDD
jgi:hypothetical protein